MIDGPLADTEIGIIKKGDIKHMTKRYMLDEPVYLKGL